ncbi:hypothetical protein LPJ59_006083 [Coemansia sp. RSA 2399]|nr:hypothetical protein LPJ59_006083 [Coemansia sp. RSA 2399]
MDFIDFFSSIDDEVAANQTSQHNNNLNMAAPFGAGAFEPTAVGSGSTVVGAQQMQGQQQQQQQAGMTDFDAMFQALSNPFAASNGNGGFSEPSTAGSNNVQQQPFDGFSGASMNMPFATAASNNGPAMGFSSAGTTTSSQMQNSNVGGGGYASVSANNPFRQSMYPVQSDGMSQQAVMAQANVQQASYNPFAQRQTMYMDTSSAAGTGNFPLAGSMPFGNVSSSSTSSNTIMVSQTTTGGGFGNNNNNIGNAGALTGFPQQQQQQQQMHMRTASSAAMSSNGNFANFDVFK